MAKGKLISELFEVAGRFLGNAPLHKPHQQTFLWKPKRGTASWAFAVEDHQRSLNNPKWLKNRYVDDSGKAWFLEPKVKKEVKPDPSDHLGMTDAAKKYKRESNYDDVRQELIRKQTAGDDEFYMMSMDEWRNRARLESIKGGPIQFRRHHRAGLAKWGVLYEGLSEANSKKLTEWIEENYPIFMGNHKGNAIDLPDVVHRKFHAWLSDKGWMQRTLKSNKTKFSSLNLKERKKLVAELVEEQAQEDIMVKYLMDEFQGNEPLERLVAEIQGMSLRKYKKLRGGYIVNTGKTT
tara:strand:- start:659 stop:1537 length:879 start_codon:yes stop_codon:yes gene_type:complete